MGLFFWQKKPPPLREVPVTALLGYPYMWRMADRKCFKRGKNGLYVAEDGEEIHLYISQRASWGEIRGYIFSQQSDHFPFGSQFLPEAAMPKEDELLRRLALSEETRATNT